MKIKIASIKDLSLTDGFGFPAPIVFFQGCSLQCPECHNKTLQDPCGGEETTTEAVVKQIQTNRQYYGAVIYQGGEPTEQLDALTELMKQVHKLGLVNVLYTGHDTDDLPKEALLRIIDHADIVKFGRYDETLKRDGFPASSNQHVVCFNPKLASAIKPYLRSVE